MRKICFFITILTLSSLTGMAQTKSGDILGVWNFAKNEGTIQIYTEANKFFGKILSGNEPERLDTKNPDPKLRSQKLIGSVILKNFSFNGKDKWEDGTIYDPNSGKLYSCNIRLKDNKTLEVRGYIGISLFGRTEIWTR